MGLLRRAGAALWALCGAAAAGCTWTLQSTDCARSAAALGASQQDDSGAPAADDTGGSGEGGEGAADGGEGSADGADTADTGGSDGADTGDTGGAGDTGDTGDTGDPPGPALRALLSIDPSSGQTLCNRVEDGLDPAGERWVYGGYFIVSPSGGWSTGRWYQRWAADDACPLPSEWAPAALLDFSLRPTGASASWEPRAQIVEAKPDSFAMIALEPVPSELFIVGESMSAAPTSTWTATERPPPARSFYGAARDDGEQVWVNEMSLHNVIPYEGGADVSELVRRESALPFAPAPLPAAVEAAAAGRW